MRSAAVLLLLASAVILLPRGAHASAPLVSVFPIPGARVASPQTQVTFRGIGAGALESVAVTGSRSGAHQGMIAPDSDGRGGSFLPYVPFQAGEVVTVNTSLNIAGGQGGTFSFTTADPAQFNPILHWPVTPRTREDLQRFRSRPDLRPAGVSVVKPGSSRGGDIFVGPEYGPLQDGPMILDPSGKLIWFQPLSGIDWASDFRVQTYRGARTLTWWQGHVAAGYGVGEDVIEDSSYRQVAVVRAGNGLSADMHEFQLTPQGTALITAFYPVYWDTSAVHGPKRKVVLDSVVQEIDIPTGLVLFQWDSLDHVPLAESFPHVPPPGYPYDYFHVNSIDPDADGNLLISARNTWAAYKISRQTGAIMWRLGGKRSSFRLLPGAYWAFQHDARVRADGLLTLFDDDAGPPTVHSESRALELSLDLRHMRARLVRAYSHLPRLSSNFQGNTQRLPNGDEFVGWGQQPYFTEFNPHGQVVFDARFVDGNPTYRAYRFPWHGTPQTPPAIATTRHGRKLTVYASWNGATEVHFWRVLGGSTTTSLRTLARVSRRGFETAIPVRPQRYVAVQALDFAGRVMATSPVARA